MAYRNLITNKTINLGLKIIYKGLPYLLRYMSLLDLNYLIIYYIILKKL
jgi:hypothetical protein